MLLWNVFGGLDGKYRSVSDLQLLNIDDDSLLTLLSDDRETETRDVHPENAFDPIDEIIVDNPSILWYNGHIKR